MAAVRFISLELHEVRLPFRLSFSHHLASRTETFGCLVILRTDNGAEGYGQVLPRHYLTGETVESAVEDIKDRWWPALKSLSVKQSDSVTLLLNELRPIFHIADSLRRNASYSAIDVSAVDAYARACGISGHSLWGQTPSTTSLVGAISGGGMRKAAWTARVLRFLGYQHFKIKVGTDANRDHERIAAVRRIIGGASLHADANAAWQPEEAVERMRALKKYGIVMVEQPCADLAALADLKHAAGMPVMADESICTLADGERLLQSGAAGVWNLRLAKNGGFSGIAALSELAGSRVDLYGGVLVGETSALAAAGRASAGLAAFNLMEYGFPRVLLRHDPFRGGPGGFTGFGEPLSASPGLGVRLNRKELAKVSIKSETLS